MSVYYLTINLKYTVLGQVLKTLSIKSDLSTIVGSTVDLSFETDMVAHTNVTSSYGSLFTEIQQQKVKHIECKGKYSLTSVLNTNIYIILTTDTQIIKANTIHIYKIFDISPFVKGLSVANKEWLMNSAKYFDSPEFKSLMERLGPTVEVVHTSSGTSLVTSYRKLIFCNAYHTVLVKSDTELCLYDIIVVLWNTYISEYPDKLIMERFQRYNNSNSMVYIDLCDVSVEEFLSNEKFIRGCLDL